MADENATQGARASVVVNEVEAVMHRPVKPILREEDLSRFRDKWAEISKCFQNQKAFELRQ